MGTFLDFLTSREIQSAFLALMGVFVGMLFSTWLTRHTLQLQARLKFQAAFIDDLAFLTGSKDRNDDRTAWDVLRASHRRHHLAYIELWACLGSYGRRRLEKQWRRYQYGEGPSEGDAPFTYLATATSEDEVVAVKLALRNIQRLIA